MQVPIPFLYGCEWLGFIHIVFISSRALLLILLPLMPRALVPLFLHSGLSWWWPSPLNLLGLLLELLLLLDLLDLLALLPDLSGESIVFLFALLFLLIKSRFGSLIFLVQPLNLPLVLVGLASETELLPLSLRSLLLEAIDLIDSLNDTLLDHLQTSLQASVLSD